MERADQYIGIAPEKDAPAASLPDGWPREGRVDFEGVSMAYRDSTLVLKNVTLRAAAGQRVAIVGRTGAGKSSLFQVRLPLLNDFTTFSLPLVLSSSPSVPSSRQVLLRMVDVSGGRVAVDGVDVRTVPRAVLRSRIAVIAQVPNLLALLWPSG